MPVLTYSNAQQVVIVQKPIEKMQETKKSGGFFSFLTTLLIAFVVFYGWPKYQQYQSEQAATATAASLKFEPSNTLTNCLDRSRIGCRTYVTPLLLGSTPVLLPLRNYSKTTEAIAHATATVTAVQTLAPSFLKFGPNEGQLIHTDDRSVPTSCAKVTLTTFTTVVRFFNPYSTTLGLWDYGIIFRSTGGNEGYRLIIHSNSEWRLDLVDGNNPNGGIVSSTINRGVLSNLDTQPLGYNTLRLVVVGENGYFFLNEIYISKIDLLKKQDAGDVCVATAMYRGERIKGEITYFQNFSIFSYGGMQIHSPLISASTPISLPVRILDWSHLAIKTATPTPVK